MTNSNHRPFLAVVALAQQVRPEDAPAAEDFTRALAHELVAMLTTAELNALILDADRAVDEVLQRGVRAIEAFLAGGAS